MEKQIQYQGLEQLPEVAAQIAEFGKSELVWLFERRTDGAGKGLRLSRRCVCQLGLPIMYKSYVLNCPASILPKPRNALSF